MVKKIIVVLIISILLISNIILALILLDRNNSNNAVGIYHSLQWNNQEAILQLNEDGACKYPNTNHICTWVKSDKNIVITLGYYTIVDDHEGQYYGEMYNTIEKCENDIQRYNVVYNFINPKCKLKKDAHEAVLTESGVVLHEKLFNKIG